MAKPMAENEIKIKLQSWYRCVLWHVPVGSWSLDLKEACQLMVASRLE